MLMHPFHDDSVRCDGCSSDSATVVVVIVVQ